MQALKIKYLRRVKGVTIRNEQLTEELGMKSILEWIQERQFIWWEHMRNVNDNMPVKIIRVAGIQYKRELE